MPHRDDQRRKQSDRCQFVLAVCPCYSLGLSNERDLTWTCETDLDNAVERTAWRTSGGGKAGFAKS
jgi:hypothetical protein